jgi:hypothetical protein
MFKTAVVADHKVLRILRIDPDRVLIDVAGIAVAAGVIERGKCLPAVERFRDGRPAHRCLVVGWDRRAAD